MRADRSSDAWRDEHCHRALRDCRCSRSLPSCRPDPDALHDMFVLPEIVVHIFPEFTYLIVPGWLSYAFSPSLSAPPIPREREHVIRKGTGQAAVRNCFEAPLTASALPQEGTVSNKETTSAHSITGPDDTLVSLLQNAVELSSLGSEQGRQLSCADFCQGWRLAVG